MLWTLRPIQWRDKCDRARRRRCRGAEAAYGEVMQVRLFGELEAVAISWMKSRTPTVIVLERTAA